MKGSQSCNLKTLASCFLATFLTACAGNFSTAQNQGITHVDGDVYEIFREDYRGVFGSESSFIEKVVNQASEFAESQQGIAIPVSAKKHKVGILGDWAWFYYKFRLVDKNDPEASKQFADIEIEADVRMAADFQKTKYLDAKKTMYEDLLQLDDLRKKGILTEDEFEAEKKKMLNKN